MLRLMPQPGSFKVASRHRSFETSLDPAVQGKLRVKRTVESLREEIRDEATTVRARRIFERPRELFRLEIQNPDMGYQRTTLLDRETLDALCSEDAVRCQLDPHLNPTD